MGRAGSIARCRWLSDLVQTLRALCRKRRLGTGERRPIFVGARGERLTRFGVTHVVRRAVTRATANGCVLAAVSPHVLRHTLAMQLQRAGADLVTTQAWLGHAQIANARTVLLRGARDRGDPSGELASAAARLASAARRALDADMCPGLDELRGLEGEAARAYFAAIGELLAKEQPSFAMEKRSRRPPMDRMNALLSFLYAMLGHDARSACESCGLDPAVGFLHRDRPGRPSLALDLMEELRPVLCDRLALSLVNRRQVRPDGFDVSASGAVRMSESTRKAVVGAYQKRKRDELVHPYLRERTTLGLLVHLQARLLSRVLRDELDGYPAFIWK